MSEMRHGNRKQFIIVLGHESSGTRLVANTLAEATGYSYDDGEHKTNEAGQVVESFLTKTVQRWWTDPKTIVCDESRITRRSLPHGGLDETELRLRLPDHNSHRQFVDPLPFIEGLKKAGYDVYVILMVRDRNIAIQSKRRVHTQGDAELASTEMDRALAILKGVLEYHAKCFVFSYEAFMSLGAPYLKRLYAFLGFDSEYLPTLSDGNRKYIPGAGANGLGALGRTPLHTKIGIVTRPDDWKWGGGLEGAGDRAGGASVLGRCR